MFFRRAAFVRINVREFAAQHRMVRAVQRLQAQHVRARAVEGKKYGDLRTEMFFKFRDGRASEGIVAVSNYVPLVGARDRFQNLRMHSSIIVAGKIASDLIQNLA